MLIWSLPGCLDTIPEVVDYAGDFGVGEQVSPTGAKNND